MKEKISMVLHQLYAQSQHEAWFNLEDNIMKTARGKLAAKTAGLVCHDRILCQDLSKGRRVGK